MRSTVKPTADDALKFLTAAAERKLLVFVQQAWPVVVPGDPFQDNWHLGAICDHLDAVRRRQIRNLLITEPPRHAKSTITAVMFPVWCWLQDATERFLTASYSLGLATRDAVAARQLIESPWYQTRWGNRVQIAPDQNRQDHYANTQKGYRLVTSVGGSTTGQGGDILILDDPHNIGEAESDAQRDAAVNWHNVVWSTRGNNPARDCRIVICQRAHYKDVAGDILRSGGYEHLDLPMEYEPTRVILPSKIGWKDPRKQDGELLWPARFSAENVAEHKRTLGSYAYSAQYQQKPSPASGGLFKRGDFRYYDPIKKDEMVGMADDLCWSWDCAFKDATDSSFVVGQLWVRVGANYCLIHQTRRRMTFSGTLAAIAGTRSLFPAKIRATLIEDKANGPAILDTLKVKISGLIPVEPQGGKEVRAQRITPLIEAHNVHLPEGEPWVDEFVEEFARFPKGEHDDQVDSCSQALTWLAARAERPCGAVVTVVAKSHTGPTDGQPMGLHDWMNVHPHERPEEVTREADIRLGASRAARWRKAWENR